MKDNFDLKAVDRSFNPGDLVLLYMPNKRDSLSARFCGPYAVKEKVSIVNYVISTPDKRKKSKLVHINLLKLYRSRQLGDNLVKDVELCKNLPISNINICKTNDVDVSQMFSVATQENSAYLNALDKHLDHLPVDK